MVLNDQLRKCIVFIAARKENRHVVGGTAFLVLHPVEDSTLYELYVVSARHCITDCMARSADLSINLRLNMADGGYKYLKTKETDWIYHPDSRVDVAVCWINCTDKEFAVLAASKNQPLDTVYNQLPLLSEWFAVGQNLDILNVTPGDDLYFPGLFVQNPGDKFNIPIIRTGSVAATPFEPIRTRLGMAQMYLAEVRSIGGHSGSPVFLDINSLPKIHMVQQLASKSGVRFDPEIPSMWGLVHGHFLMRADSFSYDDFDDKDQNQSSFVAGANDFNSGIAMIVPAQFILETLNQPELIEARKNRLSKNQLLEKD